MRGFFGAWGRRAVSSGAWGGGRCFPGAWGRRAVFSRRMGRRAVFSRRMGAEGGVFPAHGEEGGVFPAHGGGERFPPAGRRPCVRALSAPRKKGRPVPPRTRDKPGARHNFRQGFIKFTLACIGRGVSDERIAGGSGRAAGGVYHRKRRDRALCGAGIPRLKKHGT